MMRDESMPFICALIVANHTLEGPSNVPIKKNEKKNVCVSLVHLNRKSAVGIPWNIGVICYGNADIAVNPRRICVMAVFISATTAMTETVDEFVNYNYSGSDSQAINLHLWRPFLVAGRTAPFPNQTIKPTIPMDPIRTANKFMFARGVNLHQTIQSLPKNPVLTIYSGTPVGKMDYKAGDK